MPRFFGWLLDGCCQPAVLLGDELTVDGWPTDDFGIDVCSAMDTCDVRLGSMRGASAYA